MECGIIKEMREVQGGRAGGYSTSVIEQLEGEKMAAIHGRGNDTRGTQLDL